MQNKTITIKKIRNQFNPADLLTKYLSKAEVATIMEHIENTFESSRSSAAPRLAIVANASIQLVCSCPKSQMCYCNTSGLGVCHSWKNDTSSAAMQHNPYVHKDEWQQTRCAHLAGPAASLRLHMQSSSSPAERQPHLRMMKRTMSIEKCMNGHACMSCSQRASVRVC